jgi:hypothetical protein
MPTGFYLNTSMRPWHAKAHLADMPRREQAIRDDAKAGRITQATKRRKLACERGWATRCHKVIANWLPYVEA